MVDETMNDTLDLVEGTFLWLEAQVAYIRCNKILLMSALNNKLRIFVEYGGSNA